MRILKYLIAALLMGVLQSGCSNKKNNLTEKTSAYSWAGKKVAFLGDSITEFNNYQYKVQDILGFETVYNHGKTGTAITGSESWSFTNRAESIEEDADVIFVFGGTNDYHYSKKLGDDNGRANTYTFYGAVRTLCDRLTTAYPKAHIVFATPLKRVMEAEQGSEGVNKEGCTLEDYAEAIKTVCSAYENISVIDLYNESAIGIDNAPEYLYDGLHPNESGFAVLAQDIAESLNRISIEKKW